MNHFVTLALVDLNFARHSSFVCSFIRSFGLAFSLFFLSFSRSLGGSSVSCINVRCCWWGNLSFANKGLIKFEPTSNFSEYTHRHTHQIQKGFVSMKNGKWLVKNVFGGALSHPRIHSLWDTDSARVAMKSRSCSCARKRKRWAGGEETDGCRSDILILNQLSLFHYWMPARTSLNDSDLIMTIYILMRAAYNKRLLIKMFRHERHLMCGCAHIYWKTFIHSFIHFERYHEHHKLTQIHPSPSYLHGMAMWKFLAIIAFECLFF